MSAKRPTQKEIIARIKAQIGGLDRSIFDEQLATAVACGPKPAAWKKLAKDDPESWSRALQNLARMRGYADKKEVTNITPKLSDVAQEVLRRFGEKQGQLLLEAAGVDEMLMPAPAIEGEFVGAAEAAPGDSER